MRRFLTSTFFAILLGVLWCAITRGFYFYTVQAFLGISLCLTYFAWLLAKRFHPVIGLTYGYVAVYSTWLLVYPDIRWGLYDAADMVCFQSQVTSGLLFLTAIAILVCFIHGTGAARFLSGFIMTTASIDLVIMALRILVHKDAYFLMNNPAIDCAFLGVVMPLFFRKKWGFLFYIPAIIVCLLTHTSSGILAPGLAISMYLWAKGNFSFRTTLLGLCISGLFTSVGLYMQQDVLFHSSGRKWAWRIAWQYFNGKLEIAKVLHATDYGVLINQKINVLWGAGLSTYQIYGPLMELLEASGKGKREVDGFFWLHNDWLQVLFELGWVGLLLSVSVFLLGVWKARKYPAVFATLMTFGGIAIIQMPLRHFLFAFVGAYTLGLAYSSTKKLPQ